MRSISSGDWRIGGRNKYECYSAFPADKAYSKPKKYVQHYCILYLQVFIKHSIAMENTGRQLSYRLLLNSLVPPSLSTSTEIVLGPWAEDNLSTFLISITMGKSKWKRSRSTNNCTLWGILRSVARALELVGGSRPWDHTSQVSADYEIEIKSDTKLAGRTIFFSQNHTTRTSIQTVFFKSLVVLDNKVTKKIEMTK